MTGHHHTETLEAVDQTDAILAKPKRGSKSLASEQIAFGVPPKGLPDHCNAKNAKLLAERIEQYWAAQGYPVHCTVGVVTGFSSYSKIYGITSDMRQGLPVRAVNDNSNNTTKRSA
jgi:hypothetical protein